MIGLVIALGLLQPPLDIDRQTLAQLVDVRRVHVERLSGGETAAQLRDMIISSLQRAKLFVLTENPERADAVLKGSAEDLVFTDTFQSSDGISARASAGTPGSSTSSGSASRRTTASIGFSDREDTRIAERKHEAVAAVRLVNKDGDVIWSTTQESLGSKFKGSSADVADKITKQLQADYERARRLRSGGDANQLPR
ncbi:MAG: hypothetical protein Q8N47_15855 [Bryobacterales bacterium]|nr:hypothetical protein [Bryobacterales bacterium]